MFWTSFVWLRMEFFLFTGFSGILNTSGCVLRSELLTCVCISEGFPLPTINWSLPLDHTEDSVTVSDQAVRSTVKQTVKSHENISIKCFSSNENGKTEKNLTIQNLPGKWSQALTGDTFVQLLIIYRHERVDYMSFQGFISC